MKKILLIIAILCFSIGNAQINIASGGTVSVGTCGNTFVDSGGVGGDYGGSENHQITICPDTPGTYIQFEFNSFAVEGEPWDFLTLYEGTGTGGTVIGTYGDTSPPDIGACAGGTYIASSDPSGCITITFESDGSVNQAGWEANITCTTTAGGDPIPGGNTPPANSVCGGSGAFCADSGALEFENSSSGDCVPDAPAEVVNNTCLGSAPNPAWYFVEIGTAGDIIIDIEQTTGPGGTGTGLDVDFALWGPFPDPSDACVDFAANPAIDCSYSIAAVETATIPNAQVGEFYMFLITNFDGDPGYITLDQTGGTGSTDCCPFEVGIDPTSCGATDGIIDISLLLANTSYTVTYNDPLGNPQSYTTTTDATGTLQIPGLGSGTYTDIDLSVPNCALGTVTLTAGSAPVLNTLTSNDPVCSGADAVFILSGTAGATVSYTTTTNGAQTVVLDGAGNATVTIPGITADETITLTQISLSGCDAVLTNTTTVTIGTSSTANVVPDTTPICSGDDAVFIITGTAGATVSYTTTTDGAQTIVLDGAGNATVTVPGVIADETITLTQIALGGCSGTLTDTTTIVVNPMPYAGTDGTMIICDSAANAIHLIDLINGEQSGGVWAQTSGFGGTFNPNSGIYTPSAGATTATFTYTVAGVPPCPDDVSNVLISIDNTPTLVFTSSTDPTTCLGTDGTITLTTSNLPDGTYTVDYEDATATAQTATMVVVGDVGTISGLSAGDYNNITVTNVGCTSVEDVDVQLNDPPLPALALSATTGPTTCSGIDGSITLTTTNLPDGSYTVAYEDGAGTPQTATMVVSGNSGVISNLPAGDYNNITVTHINCTSIDNVDVQLTDPPLPVLAINASSDPTTCDGGDGSITLTTTNLPDGSYTVSYEDALGVPQTETIIITGDVGVITGLLEGEYNNITIVYNNCTSIDDIDVVLSDPLPSIIAIIATSNPTICDGSDGTITLSTTNLPDGTYTINYVDATATPQTTTVTVVANVGLITGLSEGTYNNITVTFISCTSIEDIDAVLVDPLPAIISIIATTDPTTCDGTDGSITLSTANLPDGTHVINYEDEFGVPQTNTMVVTGNVGVITGLSEGQFNNITVTFISCTSIDDIDVELNDPIPSIIAVISVVDPSMCNGTDGSIVLSVANLIDGVYTVNYDDANGIQQTTTIDVVNNVGTISNLASGVYDNITVISFSCSSVEDVDVVLSDPIPAIIAIISTTNPSTCGGSEGSIVLSVFNLPDGTYTIDYEDAAGLPQTSTMVVVADVGTIVGLAEGMYSNISVTNVGCTSLEDIDVVLVDPLPPVINDNMDMDPICETDAVLDGVMPHDLTLNIPYILGNQSGITVTFYEALADATSGVNPIIDEMAYLNINPTPPVSTQTIYVRAVDDITGCFTTTSFTITVNTLFALSSPEDLYACDDDNDTFGWFNLEDATAEIQNGDTDLVVTYYETEVQAEAGVGVNIDTTDLYQNIDTDGDGLGITQIIYIRVDDPVTGCYYIAPDFTLTLHVLESPELPSGELVYDLCEDGGSTDGFVEFDLMNFAIGQLGLDPTLSIDFYTGIDTSGNPIGYIPNFNSYTNVTTPDQVIYMQVSNTNTDSNGNACSTVRAITLHVNLLPSALAFHEMFTCDDDFYDETDGIAPFNLEAEINILTGGVSGLEVTFHETIADAEGGINAIQNTTAYLNSSAGDDIFARIYDASTGCYGITHIKLHVDANPTPLSSENIVLQLGDNGRMVECDGNVDGSGSIAEQLAEFDLTLWETLILTGTGSGIETGVSASYYTSYDDADGGSNAIATPESYTNTSNPQTIYVRITSDGTGVIPESSGTGCYTIVEFEIYVPVPEVSVSGNTVLCVDENGVPLSGSTLPVLSASPSTGGYEYQWALNGVAISGANNATYTATEPGEYTVTVSGPTDFDCVNYASITVEESGMPDGFDANVTTTAFSDNHQILAEATSSIPGVEFYYSLDNGDFTTNGLFTNVAPGLHYITITDGEGCWSEVVEVLVIDYPHFFTPNGDGVNDTWQIIGIEGIPISIIYIFDRYGKLLKQLDPDGAGWDGTYNGHMMPAGDYWFTIQYIEGEITPVEKEFKAHFSIKR